MCEKWEKEVTREQIVYVNKWLARTTLDIIGEGETLLCKTMRTPADLLLAAFNYSYGALDETENALSKSYSTLLYVIDPGGCVHDGC